MTVCTWPPGRRYLPTLLLLFVLALPNTAAAQDAKASSVRGISTWCRHELLTESYALVRECDPRLAAERSADYERLETALRLFIEANRRAGKPSLKANSVRSQMARGHVQQRGCDIPELAFARIVLNEQTSSAAAAATLDRLKEPHDPDDGDCL